MAPPRDETPANASAGIVAEPRLPSRLANRVAENLGRRAERTLGQPVRWDFRVATKNIPVDSDGDVPIRRTRLRGPREGDCAVRLVITAEDSADTPAGSDLP